jgi:hypothetical protein
MAKGRRAADRRRQREGDEPGVEGSDTRSQNAATDPNLKVEHAAETAMYHPSVADQKSDDKLGSALSASIPGEGPGDVTRVGKRARKLPPGGRLVVVEGPDAGAEVPLEVTPSVIGRGPKPAVALSDPTVSRVHFELRYQKKEKSWSVADLGSTSGTLKNGDVLDLAPAPVVHGDEICAGETVMRFLAYEQLPGSRGPTHKGRPATLLDDDEGGGGGGSRTVLLVAMVILALAVVGGGLGGLFWWQAKQENQQQAQLAARSLLIEAEQLLEAKDPERAIQRVEAATGLVPDMEGARPLRRSINAELDAKRALIEANRALENGDLDKCRAALRRIPDSSRFRPERELTRKRASGASKRRSLRAIKNALEDGDTQVALDLLEVHFARWPGDDAAFDLRARASELKTAKPPQNPAVKRAKKAFAKGRIDKARIIITTEAERGTRSAQRYLADLDTYDSAAQAGQGRLRLKDGPGAKKSLDRAWQLAERLGGGKGKSRLKKMLADALYLSAIAAKNLGRSCDWGADIQRASALNPKDRKVLQQRRVVDQKADSGLLKARALVDDPGRAKRVAKEHLCYARPGSRTYKELAALAR